MVASVTREKNFERGGAGRKYFSFFYTTLKLFERMCVTRECLSVRKIMKFREIHMQRRDRIYESLGPLIDLGWIRAVPGNPTLYEASEEGIRMYPEAKKVLEFHDCIMFGKWESQWRRPPFWEQRR